MKTDKLTKVINGWRNTPEGVVRTERGFHISTVMPGESCFLNVWERSDKGGKLGERKFQFSEDQRVGDVWTMDLEGEDFEGLLYCLESDGKPLTDVYGRAFSDREKWGDPAIGKEPVPGLFLREKFDWGDDKCPCIPYEDSFIYQIHVRGFTKQTSSHVKAKGTFGGIAEKIPYLKELGVTAVKLLPIYEFSELPVADAEDNSPLRSRESSGRLNYWGYTPGLYFAPKASYATGDSAGVSWGIPNAAREFKKLVRELHNNKLEIIIELYFSGKESVSLILDVLRFWVREYHVDGIHLTGNSNVGYVADDPFLAGTKLLASGWEKEDTKHKRHLGECNDGFLMDMRRFLKGDEDQINNLIFRTRRNPKGYGVINYMAETNGFTMYDMVSYEMKHNEANGENNRDGNDCNFTWNCGVEGPTRKKKIVETRKKQLRNAYLLLFLSQGTPMLLSGDEFGATKGGNNNSYCQDNEVSWLNWNLLNTQKDIYEFAKYVAEFRKKHPVFHQKEEPKIMDYLSCGHPDISYHGVKAWCPEFENYRRQLGILYCGDYCKKENGTQDDYFFVSYNMHWEPHEFSLPKLPKEMLWHLAFNTDEAERNGIYREGEELLLKEQRQFMIPARSIVVFAGLRTK